MAHDWQCGKHGCPLKVFLLRWISKIAAIQIVLFRFDFCPFTRDSFRFAYWHRVEAMRRVPNHERQWALCKDQ